MDKEETHAKILANSGEVTREHRAKVDKFFDVSEGFGDAITRFYNGGVDDILTPGNRRGLEVIARLTPLAEALITKAKYIAIIRVVTVPNTKPVELIGRKRRKNIKHAYVRVYKDLTDDKVAFQKDWRDILSDDGRETVGSVEDNMLVINHPSYVFEPGSEDVDMAYEEEPSIFDTSSKGRSPLFARDLGEYDIDPVILHATSLDGLLLELSSFENDSDFPYGKLEGITIDSPAFKDWTRGEREGHDLIKLRKRLALEATNQNTPQQ